MKHTPYKLMENCAFSLSVLELVLLYGLNCFTPLTSL